MTDTMISMIRKKWFRYTIIGLMICLTFTAYRIITVEGEGSSPRFVLMRLEDIGPGGQYGSIEQLGKLRAVLEYLRERHVKYHLAVIPRWIDYPADGSRYDVSLDQTDNPYVAAYQKVLKQAVQDGAVLGMHGYTHQVGNVRLDNGHQESGIGNEFDEPGDNRTVSAAFAEPRVQQGLEIFKKAGLKPQFWESPHYRSTPEQDAIFRSFFGLNYQADIQTNRNTPVAQFRSDRNTGYGEPSLGAAYVPTPFDYIPYNKDEKVIVDRVGKSENIPSFYYHPFLEFKYLLPVTDDQGNAVYRDGLPEYHYPSQAKSMLQKLINGLEQKRYVFYSIQDYVPFTPAHSIKLNTSGHQEKLLLGDVTGDGQTDMVTWDLKAGLISVSAGSFTGLRNEPQGAPAVWAQASYTSGAAAALGQSGAVKGTMWLAHPTGRLEKFVSDGHRFTLQSSWKIEARSWSNLQVIPQPGGDVLVAGLSADRLQLFGLYISKSGIKPMKPYKFKNEWKSDLHQRTHEDGSTGLFFTRPDAVSGLELSVDKASLQWRTVKVELNLPSQDGELRLADFNGDGREDALRWNTETGTGTVFLGEENHQYRMLSTFGPWGKKGSKPLVADLDGNGKSDLILVDRQDGYMDTALSFESR
ncbi:DUF2334 domain-containing protein [Paenibacillus rigui]|uniref:DUF2334 domain-containing protein n=1 Tax=Paenibacillus rigui TaxID=554312 RepID=A0A229UTK3_9BACL|nr:DUF2334 domain-containing protein [Paenibacillus rigui]OXM86601.1 hypothetical protein CF651_09105 [Paenibacillus rigui]